MAARDDAPSPVRRLGPYELVRELGRGGFAEVWLARRTGPGGFESRVAIKTVRTELRTDPSFRNLFLDEAKLAAQINHPNVVSIFELGEVDDVLYLVMEYVAGRPLNVLNNMMMRAGKPIPVGIVMRILADTCAGLHAAHELERDGKPLGVIHRDVSPQNILVSDKGIVKLIDFGVAKANDRLAADTTDGHTKGKLRYMAPEQAMARPVDRRADIWAVGAVAFELLEGRPAHGGDNDLARLYKLMDTSPPPAFTTDVPAPIAKVITKALERDAASRWQTAAEMRTAIEAALDECGLRVNADAVTAFFGDALASSEGDETAPVSDGAVLRGRLERPSMRAVMATVDVPAPDAPRPVWPSDDGALGEPPIETLSALDTSAHGVPRRQSRARIGAVLAVLVLGVIAVAFGLRHDPPATTAAASPEPAASASSPDPKPTTPTPTLTTTATATPTPTPTDAPDDVAITTTTPSPSPAAATSSKKPVTPTKTSRPRPTKPPAATPGSRPRYDDTIQ